MRILGIETSCDETAAAVVENGTTVLSSVVSSQVAKHAAYGGVIPELAAREHVRTVDAIVHTALSESGTRLSDVAAVAAVNRPGLVPALMVGVSYAKGLGAALSCPVVGINHVIAHVYAAFLGHAELLADSESYPLVALVVSGGHTLLLRVDADGGFRVLGQTLDDAAGEAFDKAAKILDLGYPGGPVIDRLAREGDATAVAFPRGLSGGSGRAPKPENRFNFSFSGVKTALLYHVGDRKPADTELADVVASFQEAIVDVLVSKTVDACRDVDARTLVLCGGVACNGRLREALGAAVESLPVRVCIPPPKYCADNGAMTAGLAWQVCRANGGSSGLDLRIDARFHPEQENMRVPFGVQ